MSKFYEDLVTKRDYNYGTITKVLPIVKQYIIDKQLILKGGLAMDYLLRLKGDKIYDEHQTPDYDFLSYDHVKHAYELGQILCNKFENVSVVQGFHLTTIRIFVNFESVADITYCPKSIFDRIDTSIHYQGIPLIDTILQQIDQHRALSMPFEHSGPSKVIYSRWKKDMTRYDLLYKYYPLAQPIDKTKFHKVTVPIQSLRDKCLCGFSGYEENITFNTNSVTVKLPNYIKHITVCSYTKPEKYDKIISSFMGTVPAKYLTKKIEIYHTRGQLISAKKSKSFYNVYIANPQYSMMLLLIYIIKNKQSAYAHTLYHKFREIVRKSDPPSIKTYGTTNFTESEENSKRVFNDRLNNIKRSIQFQPSNIHFKKSCNNHLPDFDLSSSPYFKMDATEITEEELPPEIIKEQIPEYASQTIDKKHDKNDPFANVLDDVLSFASVRRKS